MRRWIHCFAAFCGGCNELHSLWDITNKLVVVQLSILCKLSKKGKSTHAFHELSELAPEGCSSAKRHGKNDINLKLCGVHAHFRLLCQD